MYNDIEYLDFVNSCKLWAIEKELLYRTMEMVHEMLVRAAEGFLKSGRKRVPKGFVLQPQEDMILKCLSANLSRTDDFIKDYMKNDISEIYEKLLSGKKGITWRDWSIYLEKEDYERFVVKEANRYMAANGKLYYELLRADNGLGKKEEDEVKYGLYEMLSLPLVHVNEFRSICKNIKVNDRIHECDVIERRYIIDGYTFTLLHWFSRKRIILPKPAKECSEDQYNRINELANRIPDSFEELYVEEFGVDIKKEFLSLYPEDDYAKIKKNICLFKSEQYLGYLEILVFDKYHNVHLRQRFYDLPHITFRGSRRSSRVEINIRKLVERWTSDVRISYNAWDMADSYFNDLIEGKFKARYPGLPSVKSKEEKRSCHKSICPRNPGSCVENTNGDKDCVHRSFCKDLHELWRSDKFPTLRSDLFPLCL